MTQIMKEVKLYIPVFSERQRWCNENLGKMEATLLNASKLPVIRDYLPNKEILVTHLLLQRLKLQKDKNYKPEPYIIQIERSIFMTILNEVKKRDAGTPEDHIALFTKYPGVPICLIFPK